MPDPEMLRYFDAVGISLDSRLGARPARLRRGDLGIGAVGRRRAQHRGVGEALPRRRSGWSLWGGRPPR